MTKTFKFIRSVLLLLLMIATFTFPVALFKSDLTADVLCLYAGFLGGAWAGILEHRL